MAESPKSKVDIVLTEEEAAVAARLLSQLVAAGANGQSADVQLHNLAAGIHIARRERRHFFPDDLFADPAWDVILSLYCAESRGERLSVTGLAHSIGLPHTTVVRWVSTLGDAGLIERERDKHDRRRHFLRLSDQTQEKLSSWLKRVASLLDPSSDGLTTA